MGEFMNSIPWNILPIIPLAVVGWVGPIPFLWCGFNRLPRRHTRPPPNIVSILRNDISKIEANSNTAQPNTAQLLGLAPPCHSTFFRGCSPGNRATIRHPQWTAGLASNGLVCSSYPQTQHSHTIRPVIPSAPPNNSRYCGLTNVSSSHPHLGQSAAGGVSLCIYAAFLFQFGPMGTPRRWCALLTIPYRILRIPRSATNPRTVG